jgi:NAD(P)-dependent dehydrogenase (short-subunit alcohol dehydrogenase family)
MSPTLVIVGAGPGLGAAVAARFADPDWTVGLVARRAAILEDLLADLRRDERRLEGTVADVTDPPQLDRACDELAATTGVPSVMVYNASLYQPEPALELSRDALQRSFDVHVLGALNAARSAVRLMRPTGRGTLIFTINCLALYPEAVSAAMSIGKGAQHNLALSLELELADTGIKVAIITITAPIKPGTSFDPERIAELYWKVANQDPAGFERDHVFAGVV